MFAKEGRHLRSSLQSTLHSSLHENLPKSQTPKKPSKSTLRSVGSVHAYVEMIKAKLQGSGERKKSLKKEHMEPAPSAPKRRIVKAKRHLSCSGSSSETCKEAYLKLQLSEKRKRLKRQENIPEENDESKEYFGKGSKTQTPGPCLNTCIDEKINIKSSKKSSPMKPASPFSKDVPNTKIDEINSPSNQAIYELPGSPTANVSKSELRTPSSLRRNALMKANVAKFEKVISGRISKRQTFNFNRAFTAETPETLNARTRADLPKRHTRQSAAAYIRPVKTPKKSVNMNETFEMDEENANSSGSLKPQVENPKKRRTYELEDTVNDLDELKNASTPSTPILNEKSFHVVPFTPGNDFDFGDSSTSATKDDRRTTLELEKSTIDSSILKLAFENDPILQQGSVSNNVTLRRKFNGSCHLFDSSESPLKRTNDESHGEVSKEVTKTPLRSLRKKQSLNSSTPLVLLKSLESEDDGLNSIPKEKSSSFSTNAIKKSKVKVPNFALIHQKAYEKMEDLKTYQLRKGARAKTLLSGKKPEDTAEKSISETRSKKKLRFAADVVTSEKHDLFIPLPNTPKPKVKLPVEDLIEESPRRNLVDNRKKENSNPFNVKTAPKIIDFKPKKGFTRFGFKLPSPRKALKENNAIASSTTGRVTKRQTHIKGVRSNRRFDLLMQMRATEK